LLSDGHKIGWQRYLTHKNLGISLNPLEFARLDCARITTPGEELLSSPVGQNDVLMKRGYWLDDAKHDGVAPKGSQVLIMRPGESPPV